MASKIEYVSQNSVRREVVIPSYLGRWCKGVRVGNGSVKWHAMALENVQWRSVLDDCVNTSLDLFLGLCLTAMGHVELGGTHSCFRA